MLQKVKKLTHYIALATLMLGAASPLAAKTFVFCSEASPEGFDPALYSGGNTFDASARPVYDRLTQLDPKDSRVLPALATDWTISDDGLEYTFTLRQGVKFHTTDSFTPTRDFNADDVVFTFERAHDKNHPWHSYLPSAAYSYYGSMGLDELIKSVEKLDDTHVKITLTRPDAPFLASLAMQFISIGSREYADQLAASGNQHLYNVEPVGTGPFIFVAYQKDAVIRYRAHDDYYDGRPKIDDLVFAITPDPAVRAQKLRAGECHLIAYPAPADIASLKADPNIKVDEAPGLNVAYMAYNTAQAPFDRPEVRRALNQAVNKQAIVDAVFEGGAMLAKNPIPPSQWSYNDAVIDDVYDPAAARAALEEAGVQDLEMKIWAMPVSRPYMPNARRTAELMQADLAKIGVDVEIISYEWGEYLKRAREPERDGAVILGATSDYGDPDDILGYFFTCTRAGNGSNTNWCHRPVEEALQQARIEADSTARAALYAAAQREIHAAAPWLPIAHSRVVLPMSNKVKNYVMEPLGMHRFKNIDLEE